MARDNVIGIAMELDVTDLKAGLKQTQNAIKTANKEFAATTAGMDDWSKSSEGLEAKLKQLSTVLLNQKKNVKGIEAELERAKEQYGENSEAVRILKDKLLDAQAAVGKTEKAQKKYKKALSEVTSESGNASSSMRDLEKAAQDVNDGFTVAKGAVAGFIANGLSALVGSIKNSITSMYGLADATREYRETLATIETVAKEAGVSTDYIKDKFTDLSSVLKDEDAITEGLNNLMTAGFDESNLDDITRSLEGASIKWKDTLKFEGLSDSLQEWIGSSGESLTGNFAELLERMGYNLEDVKEETEGFNDAQRRNYAMNLLNSQGLGKVSDSYREQNKDMVAAKKANADYQQTLANVADKIEPITTKIREGFTRILEKMLELTENVDMEALGEKIDKAFDTFINEIVPKIIEGLTWIKDNKDEILATIIGIGTAFTAWKVVGIINGIVKAFKAWKVATEGLTVAQKLMNLVMKANPIGIIITIIAGLVAAFITLWNTSDEFREFWINLWEKIKEVCKIAWDWIVNIFQSAWEWVKETWTAAGEFFSGLWEGIKDAFKNVKTFFKEKFKEAWEAVKSVWSKVGDFFGGLWDTIKEKFTSLGTTIADAISNAVKSAINGVIGTIERRINFAIKLINGAIDIINKIPGVSIGKIDELDLPRLAKGGVVNRSTIANIGEDGKEAVLPLERNTGWMKALAKELVNAEHKIGGGSLKPTQVVNNFNQVINAPKQPSRIELYRQTKNLLALKGGY